MYIYYHPWKPEVRDSLEVNKTLSKLGYTIIPESAVCMVRKTEFIFNLNWLRNNEYSKCDGNLKIFHSIFLAKRQFIAGWDHCIGSYYNYSFISASDYHLASSLREVYKDQCNKHLRFTVNK